MEQIRRIEINGKDYEIKGDSVFIRYSANADGTDFTETWSEGQNYIGFASATEAPTQNTDYTWVNMGYANIEQYVQEYVPKVATRNLANLTFKNLGMNENGNIYYGNGVSEASAEEYIEVTGGEAYTFSWTLHPIYSLLHVYQYDENKTYITVTTSRTNNVNKYTLTVDDTCKYIRIRFYSYKTTQKWSDLIPDKFQMELGTEATEYVVPLIIDPNIVWHPKPPVTDNIFHYNLGALTEGYIAHNSGAESSATSYRRTDYIKLASDKLITTLCFSDLAGLAFYDRNKVYISGVGRGDYALGDEVEISVPSNAVYFRTCALTAQAIILSAKIPSNIVDISTSLYEQIGRGDESHNPCDYAGGEFRAFKKCLCIGDSLTEGTFDYYENGTLKYFEDADNAYPAYLKAITGRENTNLGVGGDSTKTWYERHKDTDLSGYDCAIIALGLNDCAGDTPSTTSEERQTALTNIVNKLKNENNGIKIFISTVFKCYRGTLKEAMNADIAQFANATEDVYLMDVYTHGHIEYNSVYHAGHLTALGYERLARDFYNYASYIIHNNPEDFKFVQYIGSTKKYK